MKVNLEIPCLQGAGMWTKMTTKLCFSWLHSALMTLCALTASGCKLSDPGLAAYLPPGQFFAALTFEHHAINLATEAPYDTVTLVATPLMGDGSIVPGELTYRVSDSSLRIAGRVLKAERPVARAVVYVTLTHGTTTRTDSAIVSVSAGAPNRLRDFGLRVPAGDSAKTAVGPSGGTKLIPLLRESESGANLSAMLVSLTSSDTTVARIIQSGDSVQIQTERPGRVVLYASTFAFGTAWRDSLVFTSGWPLWIWLPTLERLTAGSLTKKLDFAFQDITVGVGGCVTWQNLSETIDLDVQFDDSLKVSAPSGHSSCAQLTMDPSVGGNIAPFRAIPYDGIPEHYLISYFSRLAVRVFSVPGVFRYRSTLHGTGGIVRVCDEQNDTTCAPSRLGGWY